MKVGGHFETQMSTNNLNWKKTKRVRGWAGGSALLCIVHQEFFFFFWSIYMRIKNTHELQFNHFYIFFKGINDPRG